MFLVSLAGLAFSLFFLITDLPETFSKNDIIYIVLLLIVLANSIVGLIMTIPSLFKKKDKIALCR